MTKKIETWTWVHGKGGFTVVLSEASFWGKIASTLIESSDMDWWGKHKNLPFCWINPWGWTYKLGTEEHNLGVLWWILGQKVLNFGYRLEKEKKVMEFSIPDEVVKSKYPDIWEWAHCWGQEEDDE